ncbi:MAG: hypothetical protein JNN07_25760 [Verrucomicrobiales bacterium]|nr:hypothetical protein [Verrucomicrobiales bacterium]
MKTSVLQRSVLFLLLSLQLPAQQSLDQMISTTGTTVTDNQGRHWGYVVWGSPTTGTQGDVQVRGYNLTHTWPSKWRLGATKDRRIAVYRKTGAADAAADYQRLAVTGIQTDPIVIDALLERAAILGHSRQSLEERIDGLFGDLVDQSSPTLGVKVSAVIRGGLDNPNHCENLMLLSRQHAGLAFCLGLAHAELIPGPIGTRSTFELRLHDAASGADEGVMGRVTVTAGQPLVLPPPGKPMETIDVSPKGDLNVKILWSTPPALRRLSLANYGFNVYRINAAHAEQQGFHVAPPSVATLLSLVNAGQHGYRLNLAPVLASQQLDDLEVAALAAGPTNYFFSDSNDRAVPEEGPPQEPFKNGAEFYYFVTARDVLGRDGLVSEGRKVRICDRMPPLPPRYVRVENVYAHDPGTGKRERRLKIIWDQNIDQAPERTTGYYVHRWTSLQEMQDFSDIPNAARIVGPIPHIVGQKENSFIDTTPLSPNEAFQVGKPFWYTVRAIDHGACAPGGNVSHNSSPAFGVIREFEGPKGGGGNIRIRCVQPTLTFKAPAVSEPDPLPDQSVHDYRLECIRTSSKVKHVDFLWFPTGSLGSARHLGRRVFRSGEDSVDMTVRWRWSEFGLGTTPRVICRITLDNGKTTEAQVNLAAPASPGLRLRARFEAGITVIRGPRTIECGVHDPVPEDGDDSGLVDPLWVDLFFPDDCTEWRLYRSVDQGPASPAHELTHLIQQGEGDFGVGDVLPVRDQAIPANACEICYFIQYLDKHGNAGPLLPIGCVRTEGTQGLPTPVLSKIQPLGTAENPSMELKWTCATPGVERFEVWVGGMPEAPPQDLSSDLEFVDETPASPFFASSSRPSQVLYRRYHTRRIGPGFGTGPQFTVPAKCFLENRWVVVVRALGASGELGPLSNSEGFIWQVPGTTDPNVPWPARALPAPSVGTFPQVLARFIPASLSLSNPWEGVAVRIGTVNMGFTTDPAPGQPDRYQGQSDPLDHVYRSPSNDRLLGVVLYRWQVPNEVYPEVSGDVIQVSPMIDKIAWEKSGASAEAGSTLIRDPFIRLFPELPPQNDPVRARGIYLLDTQPVLEGAAYQYSLVRFSPVTREPVESIHTNPVTVP